MLLAAAPLGGQRGGGAGEIPAELRSPPGLEDVKPLIEHAEPPPSRAREAAPVAPAEPLTRELFLDPPARYRPWTRWWWLGNLVDEAELEREVALFSEQGFGGVEIQAFSLGDRVDRRPGVREQILSYDSDSFWRNVRATLEAARRAGLGVDLNHGSGWPAGGPWVGLADTYETLIYGETSVEGGTHDSGADESGTDDGETSEAGRNESGTRGGRELTIVLPEPRLPLGFELTLLLERVFGGEVISFPVEHRRLVAVVAAREIDRATQHAATPPASRPGYDAAGELVVRDGSETGRFAPIRDQPAEPARPATATSQSNAARAAATGPAGNREPRAPVALDPTTLRVLDAEVRDGKLRWRVPAGRWRVIAIYAMPGGEAPTLVAAARPGLVLDHFDAGKVKAHYDYLFGSRTGIDRYWGDPLRGFFNDSLEFKTERHWASGFFEEFARRRGYDLRPWLPALFVAGADNFFVSDVFGVHPEPDFVLTAGAGSGVADGGSSAADAGRDTTDVGERVRWDYELTVSELVTERFFDASREWAAARGLQSRAQGYGMALDAIGAAGHIDIPETEALYAGGSDLFLKLASSGAHLYGRPLVSAESFVWRGAEYRTTPQKVRAAADKLFAAGVNHVIWHGTPYRVARTEPDGFGEEGWYPWSIPGATLGFSTNFSEASPFWSDAAEINRYLARSQAVLRQGRPEADVLVYYPFLRFPSSFGNDPEVARREDLFNGWLPEVEPEVPASSLGALMGGLAESREDPLVPWLRQQQALLQTIEEAGLTWEWTNADALESAVWREGGVEIGDGRYGAILLASAPWLPLSTAEAVARLAEAGAPVLIAGEAPARQPGLFERERADAAVRAAVARVRAAGAGDRPAGDGVSARNREASALPRGTAPRASSEPDAPADALRAAVAPSALVERRSSSPAIRHLGRALGVDRAAGAVVLVRNASAEPASTELRFPRSPSAAVFLLDAVSGAIRAADVEEEGWITIDLAPRDSILLATGVPLTPTPIETWPAKWLLDNRLAPAPRAASASSNNRLAPFALTDWALVVAGPDLEGGGFERGLGPLFDWRGEARLRRVSSPGRYRTVVELGSVDAGLRYLLDLGRVLHTAEVTVNGRALAPLLFSPFSIDITGALRPGANTIEVVIRSPLLNRFIGWGDGGDARYARFAGRDPIATGLLGPVVLRPSAR